MNKIKQILKSKFRTGLKTLPYLLIAILIGATTVYAVPSKLTPPGAVSNTMYSLTDIYELATNGTPATVGTGDIEETPTLGDTGVTLTEVYDAVLALTESGGSPTLIWQTDPALNLCWSHNQYEIDNECTVGAGFIDASLAQDGSLPLGAVEYCQYLNEDGTTLAQTPQNIWHLPTIQEYFSITDYTLFNNATEVTGFIEDSNYWSSTEYAEDPDVAWFWGSWNGYTLIDNKNGQSAVRCAH